jgi:two-component system response regulator WspF
LTIAQDQQSSAVYGMPKAAAAIDAAVEIRPLERIAGRLLDFFEMTKRIEHAAWPAVIR